VHSNKDIVVMAISVFLVEQHLPEAQLVIYPDANHGAASQQRKFFLSTARNM
jgi:pimeloyl-ACP methyl ester carboxylesterase